jgi:hypothetical protein
VAHKDKARRNEYSREYRKRRKAEGRPLPNYAALYRVIQAGCEAPDRCQVCSHKQQRKGHQMVFDHDHRTGQFRGWLCHNCNVVLGLVADSPMILRALAGYLERLR